MDEIRGEMQRAGRILRANPNFYQQVGTRELPPWDRVELARFGEQEPPVGTLLRWLRPAHGEALTYVALRAGNGRWYVTGQERGPQDWLTVAGWIGDSECHVAVSWREIPRPEPVASGDDAVRDWAAQFLPESASEAVDPAEVAE